MCYYLGNIWASCPDGYLTRGPVSSVARVIWMEILDQVTPRLEVKDVIADMDGVEAVYVEVEVLGVQNAEALVVGEELKGVELEEVELEGVEAVQADSRPIKPDRI
ncbi:hypothetical protein BOTNAR_0880g00030 [Botryotinia narcissicola]|uniref:Uncharacterized protein n=1 Tax=Botryotinia narcissicola TaxID=278944 RepID=A0A4Z1H634_9HELO|nr:hypothetical protein BOTNAR_0880g00030 [Botryotinia narcissicola]